MERKSTELINIVDEILRAKRPEPPKEEPAKEASVADVDKTGKAQPDSVRQRKVKVKEMEGEEEW